MIENTYFEITTRKGDTLHSEDVSWHDHAHKILVDGPRGKRQVFASHTPITSLYLKHEDLEKRIDIPADCSVFTSIVAETVFISDGEQSNHILGMTLGLIKEGRIIEEYFLDSRFNQIWGSKY